MRGGEEEVEIERLPLDLLAHIFSLIVCFKDLAQASRVCRKWKQGVEESLARREKLSFSGWKTDDESTPRLVRLAYSIKELDILMRQLEKNYFEYPVYDVSICMEYCRSRSRWGCHITDDGLQQMSKAKCVSNLSSVSLWGLTAVTDHGVIQLISEAKSLQHLNVGGTFITDASIFAIADCCPRLKSLVLWGCRQVTEIGLLVLVNKCHQLESINVWGMRVPIDCLIALLTVSPALQIRPKGVLLNDDRFHMWPIR